MTSLPAPPTGDTPSGKPRNIKRQEQFDSYDAFVAYIVELCARSTKAQSDLRTGLGRPLERSDYLHRYLVPRLPTPRHPGWYDAGRRAHYAIASLVAARPRIARDTDRSEAAADATRATASTAVQDDDAIDWWKRPSLGASLAEAVNRHLLKPDTAEADLHLMVRQGSEALQQRLPALTRHLLGGGVRIDWSVLLDDLARWDLDRDKIATRWLEAYFQVRDPDGPDGAPDTDGVSGTDGTDGPDSTDTDDDRAPRKENR